MMAAKGGAISHRTGSVKYLREVRTELKKVTWPTLKQTATYTGFVVTFTLLVVLVITILDTVFNFGLHQYLR